MKNADLGLRQAVVHDAHEAVRAHRIADQWRELLTAFGRVHFCEVDDGHGRVFDFLILGNVER